MTTVETRTSPRARAVYRLSLAGWIAALVIVALLVLAFAAPILAPADPIAGTLANRLMPIGTPGHPLGSDGQGRDILSRLLYGTYATFVAGVTPVLLSTIFGTFVGVLAGLRGGWVHALIMRPLDVVFAFPGVILALSVASAVGSGIAGIIISLSIVGIAPVARIAESEASRLAGRDWLSVARTSGAGTFALAFRHVLPNVLPTVIAYATALVGAFIAAASGLGFLGLGVQPPAPEWGAIIRDLQPYIYQAPLQSLLPVFCVAVMSCAFAVLGDAVGDSIQRREERS